MSYHVVRTGFCSAVKPDAHLDVGNFVLSVLSAWNVLAPQPLWGCGGVGVGVSVFCPSPYLSWDVPTCLSSPHGLRPHLLHQVLAQMSPSHWVLSKGTACAPFSPSALSQRSLFLLPAFFLFSPLPGERYLLTLLMACLTPAPRPADVQCVPSAQSSGWSVAESVRSCN